MLLKMAAQHVCIALHATFALPLHATFALSQHFCIVAALLLRRASIQVLLMIKIVPFIFGFKNQINPKRLVNFYIHA